MKNALASVSSLAKSQSRLETEKAWLGSHCRNFFWPKSNFFILTCDSDLFIWWQCEPHKSHGIWSFQFLFLPLPYVVLNLIKVRWKTRWRRGWQPCCELQGKLCSFSYVLYVFLLFCVLDVVSITVYDRDTLLNIGSSVAQCKPDFEFLNAGGLFTDTASDPFVWVVQSRKAADDEKEEKELAFSSDWDAVLSDLLFQPFYWPTFSHWITNSVNLRDAHLIPTRNKGLLCYLPHRNLDVCYGSRLSHRAHRLLRAPLGQNGRAHREKQRQGCLFLY